MQGAAVLAAGLRDAAARLLAVLETVDDERWARVPGPGVWSIGREVEHVAEAAVYHQWIVRLTIGERVASRRPVLERLELRPQLPRDDAIKRIREQTDIGIALLGGLSQAQLDLATRPPRTRSQRLAETIERVLIGHYDAHRADVEAKLGAGNR